MTKIQSWPSEKLQKKIDLLKIWETVVTSSQKYQPIEDSDIDDDAVRPNGIQVSFDNFEKENASEKKRRKFISLRMRFKN